MSFNREKEISVRYRRIVPYSRCSPEGLTMESIETNIARALGGDPSPQQILIIRRISMKCLHIGEMERAHLRDGIALPKDYLSWCRELRLDLASLGMKRLATDQSLAEYLESEYGPS
jgi:hypothetical protein